MALLDSLIPISGYFYRKEEFLTIIGPNFRKFNWCFLESEWHHQVLHQNENYAERYIWEKAVASSIKVFLLKSFFWKSQNGLAVGPRSPLSTLFPATVKSFDIEKNYMLKDLELFPCITWVNNLHISCETFAPRTHSVSFLWNPWNQRRRNKKGARPLFQFLLRFIFWPLHPVPKETARKY